jgi:PAS domain S-box-containing protein
MLLTDIDDRKLAEDALRASEQDFRLIVDSVPGLVWTMTPNGEVELVNRQMLGYFGKTLEELKEWTLFLHPDDRARVTAYWRSTAESGQAYEVEHRLRRADGAYRWFQARGLPQRDAQGRIIRWFNLLTDIDERKRAEDAQRRSEAYLSEAQRLSRTGSFGCKVATGEMFWSEETYRIFEYDRATKPAVEAILQRVHPEDKALVQERIDRAASEGQDCDMEYRLLLPGGSIKHVHVVAHAVEGEPGGFEFVGSVMDVTEQRQATAQLLGAFEEIKRLKDRLHEENVVLREQIDQGFMFEEIVGSSPALKTVLSSIVKVVPTGSTVMITGETGTGKELIARAIHKGSQRAGQPFITVNCASIPSPLIASELFGHEKGAFTGALQRRQGRFELAHSGTIFLDEIGELPNETQIALLRVLQERQFERVGSSRVIHTDVRIIAATNRDLAAAIASGTFRADLFYRLNIFPIHVPPLRNRKEDIPMLVEYFVKRYAEKARKQISKIDKNTLHLCQTYHWPGNIRELQNIVERSVILCTGDTFWVDESWFSSKDVLRANSSGRLTEAVQSYEKELIETALAESNGKVAGPNGAAAKLGIPRSTLDLKIKQLKIKKPISRF